LLRAGRDAGNAGKIKDRVFLTGLTGFLVCGFAHDKEIAVPAKALKAVSRSLVSLTKDAKPQRKAGEFQVLFYPYPLILLASWRLEGITP
jgi:hypothetical protein